jgi:hypothetical protein
MHPAPPIPNPPALPPLPEDFRGFLLSLAAFVPFALVVYALLVFALAELSYIPFENKQAPAALILKELPRNLMYKLGLYGHMFTRAREARKTRDVDVLILGSSYAYRGFDPRIFAAAGFKTFNLGSSAQSHLQTQVLLKRYLAQLNPKIVVYEVSPSIFVINGVESALDIIANDRNDLHSVWMALQLRDVVVFNTLVLGICRDLAGLNAFFKERSRKGSDTYVRGGFVEKRITHFEDTVRKRGAARYAPTPLQAAAFRQNIALIRRHGARLILIRAPWPRVQYDRHVNRREYDQQMAAYAEYHNFNELMDLDDYAHFFDHVHLNQWGVELFNRELIRRLCPGCPVPEEPPGIPRTRAEAESMESPRPVTSKKSAR